MSELLEATIEKEFFIFKIYSTRLILKAEFSRKELCFTIPSIKIRHFSFKFLLKLLKMLDSKESSVVRPLMPISYLEMLIKNIILLCCLSS